MSNFEINKIIENKYGVLGVHVHPDIYPEFEELYLALPASVTKEVMADFYQKFDYQGVRNGLDILENKDKYLNAVMMGKDAPNLTPSQVEVLRMYGWKTERITEMFSLL